MVRASRRTLTKTQQFWVAVGAAIIGLGLGTILGVGVFARIGLVALVSIALGLGTMTAQRFRD